MKKGNAREFRDQSLKNIKKLWPNRLSFQNKGRAKQLHSSLLFESPLDLVSVNLHLERRKNFCYSLFIFRFSAKKLAFIVQVVDASKRWQTGFSS